MQVSAAVAHAFQVRILAAGIMEEEDVLCGLQRQIAALQAARQAQLARDEAKAAGEAAIRHRAAQSTQGLIRLNVGGVEYTTSLSTLTAVPESYFSALFGGDWEQVKTPDGAVFLDRDGEVSWVLMGAACACERLCW